MGLKIDHECDWCGGREAVSLPKKGSLDLSKVSIPEGWVDKPSFPGGKVGPQDGLQLCLECQKEYEPTLSTADAARDNVYLEAMNRARARVAGGGGGKKLQSSSFGR